MEQITETKLKEVKTVNLQDYFTNHSISEMDYLALVENSKKSNPFTILSSNNNLKISNDDFSTKSSSQNYSSNIGVPQNNTSFNIDSFIINKTENEKSNENYLLNKPFNYLTTPKEIRTINTPLFSPNYNSKILSENLEQRLNSYQRPNDYKIAPLITNKKQYYLRR